MSYAPQNTAPDVSDALDGSLTTWYENINNCLKTSECVPGHYEYAQAPSYGNQCPIPENGSTKIDVSCSRFEIVDLNNSYIDCKFEFPLTIPMQHATANETMYQTNVNTYYVGFKSAFDVISQYRIYSNGDLIYTQNHANYETFLNYISLTDSAKEKSPCFATSAKIKRFDPNVPGVYIQSANSTAFTTDIELTMKIPLNAFPILQNLKYYPGFMGRLSIEIYPSYKNLVWAMIDVKNEHYFDTIIHADLHSKEVAAKSGGAYTAKADHPIEPSFKRGGDCVFSQINVEARNRYYTDTSPDPNNGNNPKNEATIGAQAFTCTTSTLKRFHLYLAKYMIKMDVYNALEMNYLQIPLLFPIQTTSNVKFTSAMGTQAHFTLQNTATLSHCDTIFVVFPANSNETTVSFNPEIKAQLNIDGKYYPREPLSTNGFDERFINLAYDALNINNNPLMTPGEDIVASMRPYICTKQVDTANKAMYDKYTVCDGDKSNFFFAVPLSTDEDFMGGISSAGSTVQIELVGDRDSLVAANVGTEDYTEAPVAIFLEDKLLKIYSMKPPGKPQIQITSATLDQIVASGGQA